MLWGTGGLAGSLLGQLAGLHPLAVAAYRLLLGGAAGLVAVRRKPRSVTEVLIVGGLFAFFQTTYFAAVALSSVGAATMTTIGAAPVLLTIAAAMRRRPRPWTLVSVAGAVAGLVLLRWSPGETAAGMILALLAAAGFAVLTALPRKDDPAVTTAFGCLAGGLLLTPAALAVGMGLPARPDVLLTAAYFGVVPTALAYAAYFRGLAGAHPVLGALSALLEPLTATVLSVVFLHERLSTPAWCGAALLVGALAIGYWRPEPSAGRAAAGGRGSRTAAGRP
ncbi:DMT family transporter [Amycolatopsis sp. NPDC051903]|uniref:DMT family transporter n=1 Tax=Amycolatopsis sp. NPDC051903 TaxID=3363936 RepID=UPI00379C3F7A